jgi:hypothetical protein
VLKALQGYLARQKVAIYAGVKVTVVTKSAGVFKVSTVNKTFNADKVIIATGGKSYPATGSTGDGYSLASHFGHSVVPPRPSDVPLVTEETFVKRLQGLSLKNVSLRFIQGRKVTDHFGEMLFTHYGISGPIVLDASRAVGGWLVDGPVKCSLDLKPALDDQILDRRLLKEIETRGKRQYKALLRELMPSSLVPEFIRLSGISADVPLNQLSKQQRTTVKHLLKHIELTISSLRGFEEAVVTAGGVGLDDIDPRTMESKKVKSLYFAGEVLDLDGPCGGYNLQIAWSTGHAAGTSAGGS